MYIYVFIRCSYIPVFTDFILPYVYPKLNLFNFILMTFKPQIYSSFRLQLPQGESNKMDTNNKKQ